MDATNIGPPTPAVQVRTPPTLVDLVVDPVTRALCAETLRLLSLHAQLRGERRPAKFLDDAARLFD